MRDQGLDSAISAVGGISELARRLGISQPSVSNWTRVPAERVLAVEAVTGVSRSVLRPDLYGDEPADEDRDGVGVIDAARAGEYSLLALLLTRAPDAEVLDQLAKLGGDDTILGRAHAALAEAARQTDAARIEAEYFELFVGIGRGELLPYGSFYMMGSLYEQPLAALRDDLGRLGIERSEGHNEPEDHAAVLCEIMAGLIDGRFQAPEGSERAVFEQHLAPWIERFFGDLEQSKASEFYRRVGALGRAFIAIERDAYAMSS
jgi:TorA maturation chaperone TorD